MPTLPGELQPWIDRQFTDDDGVPLAGGLVQYYITGTVTPKDTFADAELTVANSNPGVLDAAGRSVVYLAAGGYDNALTVFSRDTAMASTGGDDPCIVNLPPSADYPGGPLTIKNMGTIDLAVTPAGAETIDTVAGPYTVPASATPLFSTLVLMSNGSSGWYMQSRYDAT
jgi:hypothetical protein